jgi:branched-chain amino acid transport system permease protein
VLTLMSEIGVMAIFALSYNMLMGQAGLCRSDMPCCSEWAPIARARGASREGRLILAADRTGAAGGRPRRVFFGFVFGWLVTKQRATAFAMITMGSANWFRGSADVHGLLRRRRRHQRSTA